LTHAILIDASAVSHVTLIILITLALVLRLFLVILFIVVASLVKERRVGVV